MAGLPLHLIGSNVHRGNDLLVIRHCARHEAIPTFPAISAKITPNTTPSVLTTWSRRGTVSSPTGAGTQGKRLLSRRCSRNFRRCRTRRQFLAETSRIEDTGFGGRNRSSCRALGRLQGRRGTLRILYGAMKPYRIRMTQRCSSAKQGVLRRQEFQATNVASTLGAPPAFFDRKSRHHGIHKKTIVLRSCLGAHKKSNPSQSTLDKVRPENNQVETLPTALQKEFSGELANSSHRARGFEQAHRACFSKLLVCLHCGLTEVIVPERELRVLRPESSEDAAVWHR